MSRIFSVLPRPYNLNITVINFFHCFFLFHFSSFILLMNSYNNHLIAFNQLQFKLKMKFNILIINQVSVRNLNTTSTLINVL